MIESGIKVLDVGCGSGTVTNEIAKRFPESEVYGLDILEDVIQKARENAEAECLTNVIFVCCDAAALPSNWTDRFDYAFAFSILHHFADPPKALKEILRVLSLGGAISVVDPNAHSNLEDNLVNNVAHANALYALSVLYDVPTTLAMGDGIALGAAFGREKTTEMLHQAGYHISSITEGMGAHLHYLCMKSPQE